jgi:hypothetical protein
VASRGDGPHFGRMEFGTHSPKDGPPHVPYRRLQQKRDHRVVPTPLCGQRVDVSWMLVVNHLPGGHLALLRMLNFDTADHDSHSQPDSPPCHRRHPSAQQKPLRMATSMIVGIGTKRHIKRYTRDWLLMNHSETACRKFYREMSHPCPKWIFI